MIRHRIHFFGNVQGVGFRYTTCSVARGFDVTGFVRNCSNGSVELVVNVWGVLSSRLPVRRQVEVFLIMAKPSAFARAARKFLRGKNGDTRTEPKDSQ